MEDKRTKALNELTGNTNGNYKKLSDGTVIGKDIRKDLEKYMELEFKYKFKVDANRWTIIIKSEDDLENKDGVPSHYNIQEVLLQKYNEDNDQQKPLKITGDMKQYNINFYTCIYLRKEINSSNHIYAIPFLKYNDNAKDKARILIDKNELDKIFKRVNIESLDSLVLLDFYNVFNKKYKNLKKHLVSKDLSIRNDIVNDLYDKLFNIYNHISISI